MRELPGFILCYPCDIVAIMLSLRFVSKKDIIMAVTSLKRKARKNRVVAKKRVDAMKRLNTKPVVKQIDIEEIKKEFAAKAGKKEAPKAKKEEKTEE